MNITRPVVEMILTTSKKVKISLGIKEYKNSMAHLSRLHREALLYALSCSNIQVTSVAEKRYVGLPVLFSVSCYTVLQCLPQYLKYLHRALSVSKLFCPELVMLLECLWINRYFHRVQKLLIRSDLCSRGLVFNSLHMLVISGIVHKLKFTQFILVRIDYIV